MAILPSIGILLLAAVQFSVDGPERIGVVEDLRIGARNGPAALTAVTSIAVDAKGHLVYVGQPREKLVRVFDARTGDLTGTIGRRGSGPGEFQTVSRLSIKSDTLCVADKTQQRISLFTLNGRHIATERIVLPPLRRFGRAISAIMLGPRDLVWGEALLNMGSVAAGRTTRSPIVQMTREGELVRVVDERDVTGTMTAAAFGGGILIFLQPFANQGHLRALAPDGSALVVVETLEGQSAILVTKIAAEGDTLFSRRLAHTPRPITESEQDSILQAYAEDFGARENPGRGRKAAEEYVRIPAWLPPIEDALIASDGRVWLKRQELSASHALWVVLDNRGRLVATVRVPEEATMLLAEKEHAWGVVRDELDVPFLIRYRLVRSQGIERNNPDDSVSFVNRPSRAATYASHSQPQRRPRSAPGLTP
jgi:hypothetical protein